MLDDDEDLDAVAEYIRDNGMVPVFPAAFQHALAAVRKARTSLTRRGLLPDNPDTFVSLIPRKDIKA
ncbi:hypothetical protein [Rhizobium sp. CSW-27]|uniref:hypothetical protein n=1 Tax=Rhizobium sp. CSW-27 TaxID=2839985 RepID=UPI001C02AEBE|nr:hypothetical protein [Rhizobium sp. CSW-27]MBT9373258.1 hypothetical protein [Rhizobium sp. CSW-27]